ncbi:oleosin-B6-like [Ornithorhynchus anatinus]|uniref:oleosin-B6-like n=1 Tax=Ornithorhynchus anatinus TaxID=9258 RepID=UPI0010A90DC3|nr:oleosin-B6-like [Ornithorhynchus anatinus]
MHKNFTFPDVERTRPGHSKRLGGREPAGTASLRSGDGGAVRSATRGNLAPRLRGGKKTSSRRAVNRWKGNKAGAGKGPGPRGPKIAEPPRTPRRLRARSPTKAPSSARAPYPSPGESAPSVPALPLGPCAQGGGSKTRAPRVQNMPAAPARKRQKLHWLLVPGREAALVRPARPELLASLSTHPRITPHSLSFVSRVRDLAVATNAKSTPIHK